MIFIKNMRWKKERKFSIEEKNINLEEDVLIFLNYHFLKKNFKKSRKTIQNVQNLAFYHLFNSFLKRE